MALFSDLDWLIVLGVGGFLLLGDRGATTVRQLGRWYGRAMRLKQELVEEVARAAELPLPAGASAGSFRAVLLGLDGPARPPVGIPAAVRTAPGLSSFPEAAPTLPWTGGHPVTSWSMTFFPVAPGSGEAR